MARVYTCDMCGKNTDKVTVKLFRSPTTRTDDYDGHADIGTCCASKLKSTIKFHDRVRKVRAVA